MDNIDYRFDYLPPEAGQVRRHEQMREACRTLAHFIDGNVPESREKSLALTKVEEVGFWANAAIARGGADA